MAQFKIEVAGEEQLNRVFARTDAAFKDLRPIWPDVRDEFWAIEKEQFASEGADGRSGKWQPLTERYLEQKIKRYGDQPILRASGELEESLTGPNDYSVYRPGQKSIEIGTSLERGLFHQQGAGNLPKRPPIDFSNDTQNRLMKKIQAGLVRELRKGVGHVEARDR